MRTLNQIAARLEAWEPSRALVDRCLHGIAEAQVNAKGGFAAAEATRCTGRSSR